MKSNIISSEVTFKRRPFSAFVLSFFFTGLGQVYNGNFIKGLIYSVLRIFSLLAIPLYLFMNGKEFSVFFLFPVLCVHLLIWIISPLEALYTASKKKFFNLRWFNSIIIYFLYAVIFAGLLTLSCMLFPKLFSIDRITSDNMNPGLVKGEYLLINKSGIISADTGDIVLFSYGEEEAAGRIIAKQGDIVEVNRNNISVNNASLSYNVFNDGDAEKMNITDFQEVFFEINAERKYAVIISQEKKAEEKTKKQFIIGDDEVLIAFDNRAADEVYVKTVTSSIRGIVQGIIFSKNMKKILNRTYLPAFK
ncbi:MAG: signal peptidase I [Spirochaetes bacterium]|nr:signal peptidase I [Spirochaetota bacterium]